METAPINKSSSSSNYTEWTENIPCIKNNRLLLPSNWMRWKVRINSLTVKDFLYQIIVYSFCTLLKDIGLEPKLYPPRCHTYLLNIHYCCSLLEAESVTKDCASRWNRLQSGQSSLRKRVSIQQHIPPLPQMYVNDFYEYLDVFNTHIY